MCAHCQASECYGNYCNSTWTGRATQHSSDGTRTIVDKVYTIIDHFHLTMPSVDMLEIGLSSSSSSSSTWCTQQIIRQHQHQRQKHLHSIDSGTHTNSYTRTYRAHFPSLSVANRFRWPTPTHKSIEVKRNNQLSKIYSKHHIWI